MPGKGARRAVCGILGATVATWEASGREAYRRLLLGEGIEAGEEVKQSEKRGGRSFHKRGIKREKALAELRNGKALSKADLLRCRVRYFSDGLVLGSRDFVEKAFAEKRDWFGPKRKSGARGLPVQGESLFTLRDLKAQALE